MFETFVKCIILSHNAVYNISILGTMVYFPLLFYVYPIAFILKFKTSLAFKTNVTSFVRFISFCKVKKKKLTFARHLRSAEIAVSILVRYILHGNILTSCSKTGGQNLTRFKKFVQIAPPPLTFSNF